LEGVVSQKLVFQSLFPDLPNLVDRWVFEVGKYNRAKYDVAIQELMSLWAKA